MTQTPANVDPTELAKFSDLAHRWWDKNSEFKPLHEINPLRLTYIDRIAKIKGKKILDVGCGGGILTESMARAGAHVTGIDMAEASLNVAELHALESGLDIKYQLISAEDCAEQSPADFDAVTCMELLEHVPDPGSIVRSCSRLVKPGGFVIFSTINRNAKAWLMAIAGAEYVLKLLPKGTHEYKRFLKPSELANFARRSDLQMLDICGLSYNPLTSRYKLCKDVEVNYLIACQRR